MTLFYRFLYRPLMRLAHRYNWHYAPPIYPEDGSMQLWCKWCGFRQTIKHGRAPGSSGQGQEKQGRKRRRFEVFGDFGSYGGGDL